MLRVAGIVPKFCARARPQNGVTPYVGRNKRFLARGVFCLFNCCTNVVGSYRSAWDLGPGDRSDCHSIPAAPGGTERYWTPGLCGVMPPGLLRCRGTADTVKVPSYDTRAGTGPRLRLRRDLKREGVRLRARCSGRETSHAERNEPRNRSTTDGCAGSLERCRIHRGPLRNLWHGFPFCWRRLRW
jgi:hypothetical protein